jgi:uncharacterized protein (TIGR00369 family)
MNAASPAGYDPDALLARVPYARYLGVQLTMNGGTPRFALPFREDLVGNSRLRALHGGVIAGFMENAGLLHLLLLDSRRVPKSIDFSIDYLRSAQAQETFAACEVERLGRRVAQVQIRCWQADENKPAAVARAHFLLAAPE